MAPFELSSLAGTWPYYGLFFLIGIAFGAVLEMAGFGDSRKLAAQFYLREMTVLKVMFTAIVVAAVLLFGASGLALLDMERVWVNPTFLVPGIVGGLVMGVGFIVGGYCPGTSVVAASTFKLDGMAFLLGVGFGVWGFGETVHLFDGFFNSTSMGRFMLPELLGVPTGVAVTLLVTMALLMFYGAEISERIFGQQEKFALASLWPRNKPRLVAASVLLGAAMLVLLIGQPDAHARWAALAGTAGVELDSRAPYVHPGEVVEWKQDTNASVKILDVRSEADFNRFHLLGASRVDPQQLSDAVYVKQLLGSRDDVLRFVISNGERDATAAWKVLRGLGVQNLYIVEGGYNKWLQIYPPDPCVATPLAPDKQRDDEQLAFAFSQAVGHSCYAAHPDRHLNEPPTDCYLSAHPEAHSAAGQANVRPVPFNKHVKPDYERKVKLQTKAKVKGGCG